MTPILPLPEPQIALRRDRDGYVHTPVGFLSRDAYERVRRDNPDLALPAHEEIEEL